LLGTGDSKSSVLAGEIRIIISGFCLVYQVNVGSMKGL
jgi:hypothetical protein